MNENICFNGFIRARNGNRTLYNGKNTVTQLGKAIVASAGLGKFFSNTSGMDLGSSYIDGQSFYTNSGNTYYNKTNYNGVNFMPTAYLLNLTPEEKAALSSSTSTIPIFNSNFEIDESKITGYATSKITASAGKEGYLTELAGDIAVNPNLHGLSYKWDAGTISGEYNTILIGSNVMTHKMTGYRINRGLSSVNALLGETEIGSYFLRPGVKTADGSVVVTSDQEILLGDSTDRTKARRVVNLVTGEVTKLDTTDDRYGFSLRPAYGTQLIYGDTMIYNDSNALIRYDIKTKTYTTITSGVYGCFIYDGYLYTLYNQQIYQAFNLETWKSDYTKDRNIVDMNIPMEFKTSNTNVDYTYFRISNLGENYLVCYGSASGPTTTERHFGLICSDPTNVAGSVIEIVPRTSVGNGCLINGKKYLFSGTVPDIFTSGYDYFANSNGQNTTKSTATAKFTTEGLYGQVLSFKTYDEPQTIDSSQSFILDYSYGFED